MRRTHSRTIHHCAAACTEGRTRAHPAHNTHQHMCTPASPPAEMDGEAANKRRRLEPKPHPASLDFTSSLPDDMLLVIIGLLPTKSVVRTALLSRWWRPLWRRVPSQAEAARAKTASGEPGLHHQPPRRHAARHHRPPPHQICCADRPALPVVAPPLAPRPPQPHRRQLPLQWGLQTHGRSIKDPFIAPWASQMP